MEDLLTSTEAARAAGVSASTIKRWADRGLLPVLRTAGGHRRFRSADVRRVLALETSGADDTDTSEWIRCLVDGRRYDIDSQLFGLRGQHSSWAEVADVLGTVVEALGTAWSVGAVSVAEEHLASEALQRAVQRVGDGLVRGSDGRACALACAPGDDHALGLTLAELTLLEAGWQSRWLGRYTPVDEMLRTIAEPDVAMLALSASSYSSGAAELAALVDLLSRACGAMDVELVVGGAGPWPQGVTHFNSFAAFADHLSDS